MSATTARRSARRAAASALLAALVAAGVACSDDTTDVGTTGSVTDQPTVTGHDHGSSGDSHDDGENDDHGEHDGELLITATDYAFEGVPESVPVGTRLQIENTSAVELHEIVVLRLPDSETRSLHELLQLGQPGLMAAVGGPPVAVIVQPPGGPVINAVGDGTLTHPGRHLLLCAIPLGADPQAYMEAAAKANGGPVTGVAGGAPHLVHGMAAELLVE